jgi:hypothetical protein
MMMLIVVLASVVACVFCIYFLTQYFLKIGDAKQSDRLPTHLPCSTCDDDHCSCALGDFDAEKRH